MHIYIDEGGTFQIPVGKDHLFSLVAALVIPASRESNLFYEFLRLRDVWGVSAIEVKGRELGERQISQVIDLLVGSDVLLDFRAIDMGWYTAAQVEEFKAAQARSVAAAVTVNHQPTMITEMHNLSQAIADTPIQLFVQAFITIELIESVVEPATMYYCQRLPEELGHFAWVVDRKDHDLTAMEKLWTTLIIPEGIRRSLRQPFTRLKGGDYTHFNRFRIDPRAPEMAGHVRWYLENITFEPGESQGILNMRQIFEEKFRFADSTNELGLQLVDILASAVRRAFNGNLRREGWEKIGGLMLKRSGPVPIIGLQAASTGIHPPVEEHAAGVWVTIESGTKSMWVRLVTFYVRTIQQVP